MLFILVLCLAACSFACPMFVEFFPDPTDVGDEEGEFVEIRLDDFLADSLYVQFEVKSALSFRFPRGANRLLLVHDSLRCPKRDSLVCSSLGVLSLPNSRDSYWRLWAGSCRDSVFLPAPKSGRALQRVAESDDWVFTVGTPGVADPDYELGLEDCGISWSGSAWLPEVGWTLRGFLSGCDSSSGTLEVLDFGSGVGWGRDEEVFSGQFSLTVPARGSAWVRLFLPADAAPTNDTLDTLLVYPGHPPVVITEVHHCPEEPMPEWVEVYNASRYPLPLSRLRFCGRGGAWGGTQDSLQPYESMIVTKDTAGLREQLGFRDVRFAYAAMGFLNNTAGSLLLCFDGSAIDSVSWTKNTVACPSGFDPRVGRAENTPGFQRHSPGPASEEPFTFRLSSRVICKRGSPLRVSVVSEFAVQVQLLDSAGHSVWKTLVPPGANAWQNLPAVERCGVGVCYVSLSVGTFKKVVGVVVRT